jgi:glutamine amidotransferase/cyclase
MIALLDYGAGNVGSVLKAVRYLGYPAEAVSDPQQLLEAEKIILPGQGHFGNMLQELAAKGTLAALRQTLAAGRPYLGICLGLQALYQGSDEAIETPGFGVIPGRARRFEGIFKVPHIGWNQLAIRPDTRMFRGVASDSFVYYCHSYYAPLTDVTAATTEYGCAFAAAVESGPIWGVQFHPEKSGAVGLQVLKNFLES